MWVFCLYIREVREDNISLYTSCKNTGVYEREKEIFFI
jgi:hypothetical protein